jgi:nucleoid DNA-binding protein
MEEPIGNVAAGGLLGFFLEEIGPVVYNQAVRDVQDRLRTRVDELDIEVQETEFGYWRKFDKSAKRRETCGFGPMSGRSCTKLGALRVTRKIQMNKSELVQALAVATDTSQAAAARTLEAFIKLVSDELAKGGEVTIPGFGSFKKSERAERSGRNPQTGAAITIAASTTVKFVPAPRSRRW